MSKFDDGKGKSGKELRVAALKYEKDKDSAPKVVAAGSGYMAERILQEAIKNGVTIYRDDSAAALLARLGTGKEIPPELYQIVVNIYVHLMTAAKENRRINSRSSEKSPTESTELPEENRESPVVETEFSGRNPE